MDTIRQPQAFCGYTNTSSGSRSAKHGAPRARPQDFEKELHDFEIGDILDGFVTSVGATGAWIDVGAVQPALLPPDKYGRLPPLVGDRMEELRVTEVNPQRRRLTVSLLGCIASGEIYIYGGHSERDRGAQQPVPYTQRRCPLKALRVGDSAPGIVRNVIQSGIFVDFGADTDGFVPSPFGPFQRGDRIEDLHVQEIDLERRRVRLAFNKTLDNSPAHSLPERSRRSPRQDRRELDDLKEGESLRGVVRDVKRCGIFFDIGARSDGLLPQTRVPLTAPFRKHDVVEGLIVHSVDRRLGRVTLALQQQDNEAHAPLQQNQNYRSAPAVRQAVSKSGSHFPRSVQRGQQTTQSDQGPQSPLDFADPPLDRELQLQRPLKQDRRERRPRSRRPFLGKSRPGILVPEEEPETEGPFGSIAPGIRKWLTEIQLQHEAEEEAAHAATASAHQSSGPAYASSVLDTGEPAADPVEVAEFLQDLQEGTTIDSATVMRTTEQGALVSFGGPILAILPQRQSDWPVRVGDEVGPLVVARVDPARCRVTLAADVQAHSGSPVPALASTWAGRGHGRGGGASAYGGGRGRGGRGQGRGVAASGLPVPLDVPATQLHQHSDEGEEEAGDRFEVDNDDQQREEDRYDDEDEEVCMELEEDYQEEDDEVWSEEEEEEERRSMGEEGEIKRQEEMEEGEEEERGRDFETEEEEEVAGLLVKIFSGQRSAARELAKAVAASQTPVQACFNAGGALKVLMRFKDCSAAALLGIQELNEKLGRLSEPLLTRLIPEVLEKYGDRQRSVQVAAEDAAETIIARLNPYGIGAVLPAILKVLQRREKTDIKVGALRLLALMRDENTMRPLARKLDEIIPHVVDMLNDVKKDVREAAWETGKVLFECAENRDLDPYLDDILNAFTNQEDIPACITLISEIVLVQPVETQALAVIMPLVQRGLKNRNEETKRKALVIADNMCKLVHDVSEISPFLNVLVPLVKKAKEHICDREVLSVADRCLQTLHAADRTGIKPTIEKSAVHAILRSKIPQEKEGVVADLVADYVADLCRTMSACCAFERAEWRQCIAPYLVPHFLTRAEGEELVQVLLETYYDTTERDDVDEDMQDGEHTLCNCVFSLGYGSVTLLTNTRLHLKRGRCYGLCGPNNCGKSTLLRAIYSEQLEGFPARAEVVTAFVEHGVGEREPESEWTPLQYIFAEPTIQALQISKKKVVAALRSLGFDEHKMQRELLAHLSGGWKMKLSLVRAMLMCADVLLLDEPTGHLDAENVSWLEDQVLRLRNDTARPVTAIIVSHDLAFLDRVCTHIITVKQRKLKTYAGNASDFLKRHPGAASCFLPTPGAAGTSARPVFSLPQPRPLDGVKSRGKKLLKAQSLTFTYPGQESPTLLEVSVDVSMLSRVAVVGPNGSGKSTLIMALVGELPVHGFSACSSIWKHPSVRLSKIAQHSFQHLEQHLDMTATQYLLWRFAHGEDREASLCRAEEVGRPRRHFCFQGERLVEKLPGTPGLELEAERILGRRRARHSVGGEEQYEYETKWRGMPEEATTWVSRERLLEMGALVLVQREDELRATQLGGHLRPLTRPAVEEHLASFGLDASLASHVRLAVLSAGQKAKVVLGAATWPCPHILILDEPTNYLDRESLEALAVGLKDFSGGFILISHNAAFCQDVCDEQWHLDRGHLVREGKLVKEDVPIAQPAVRQAYVDEQGNVHEPEVQPPRVGGRRHKARKP